MKHYLRLFIIFVLSFPLAGISQTLRYSKEVLERIKQVESNLGTWVQIDGAPKATLAGRMQANHINGLSIAVIHNYIIEWAKGYGWADSARHIPVTSHTLFQAASISKSLNGVGVLTLVRDKKIDLYTDINNYLITWKFPYDSLSKGKKISMAHLLSHTGGLTVHGFGGYEQGQSLPTIPQILDGKKPANSEAVRSMYAPGLKSEYSGGGITISQLVLTDITHQPYAKYMWENVLKPLGMISSSYEQPVAKNKQPFLATGYQTNGREIEGKYHIYPEQAAAGLWTNPTDLAKYIIETQLAYQGRSEKVLSKKLTQLRLTPFIDKVAALGVFVDSIGNNRYFQHGGANEGFRCQYFGSLSNGEGVVVMVNSDNAGILNEVINSVATVYEWKGFYKPAVRKLVSVPVSLLDRYTGKYKLRNDILVITKRNDKLWINVNGTNLQLFFTSPTSFFIELPDSDSEFISDADGQIAEIDIGKRVKAVRVL